MKPILGILLSACMVAGNSTLLIDPANAEPKIVKAGKGISKAGRTLPAALNTILSGTGTPSALLGHDGDFYIDRKSWQFFGPKIKGRWPLPVLLIGPTGSPGPSGAIGSAGPQGKVGLKGEGGSNGATGSATVTAGSSGPMGPSGPAGAPGPIGAEGAAGTAGVTGPAGPSGSAGSAGTPGAMGATGSSGLPGPTGAAGSTGATGPQGLQGATGLTGTPGALGTVGPRGPSKVSFISIPAFSLSSAVPNTDASSSAFGTLLANQNYQFSLVFHAKGGAPVNRAFAFSVGGTSTVTVASDPSVHESVYYDKVTLLSAHEYVFRGFGTATGGTLGGSLYVTVTDGFGTTGPYSMTITGTCTLQQIETID
jgi:hypothetical protein